MLSSTTKPATVLPSSNATQKSTKPSSPFDVFDDLEEVGARTQNLRIDQAPDTVRPFSAEAPHLSTDDDDILGLLGQPAPKPATVTVVAPKPTRAAANGGNKNGSSSSHTPSRPPSRATAARTPSPPPHILGQIVMMGFSVQQARLALAATLGSGQEGEWDVNAALEVLASDGAAHAARSRLSSEAEDARKFRDDGSDDEYERQQRPIAADRGKTRNQSDKPSEYSRRRDNGRDPHRSAREATRSPPSDSPANELLQQASVFGSSMLKSANAYWKTSRAQLQKAIEENRLNIPIPSGSNSGRASPASGKPRWMTDNQDQDDKRGAYSPERVSSFRDDDGGQTGGIASRDVLPVHPSERSNGSTSSSAMSGQSQQQNNSSRSRESPQKLDTNGAQPLTAVKSATLLGIPQEEKRAYVSPNRRRPVASEPPTPTSAFAPGASPVKPRPVRPARPPISATASQLAASTKHRAAGNEHFKLGRYGEAVEAYGKALESLPDGHVARIAPLNNRANARLKNGEERKASEDATAVLVILAGSSDLSSLKREDWEAIIHEIGASQGQSPFTEEGNGPVDARDALGKALSRRARGFEGCEKWRLALLDWQLLHELGDSAVVKSAGGMKVISEGLSRCRKVVEGPSTRAAPSSAPRPKTTAPTRSSKPISAPKATSLASVQHSAALDKLRQTNVQAEADEAERIRVKDAVDTRITEWRGGKETNLRALIASLDNVLWPELGWKSVGMHELISDSQLKVRYVRAISKVHPDKVRQLNQLDFYLDRVNQRIGC